MTLLLLAVLCILLVGGLPVAFALFAAALVGMALLGINFATVPHIVFDTFNIFELAAIPLFVLMSQVLLTSKVSDHLFSVVRQWVGHWPGGLALATVLSCAFFAAVAGSSTVTAATVGAAAIPAMQAAGYPKRVSYGVVVGAGTLGILIPPSIPFILYAAVTGESVARLYLAGVVPGLVLTVIFVAYILGVASISGRLPREGRVDVAQRLRFTLKHIGALLLPVIVLGGIYSGFFTPTEAAAVGTLYALLLCVLVYRSFSLRDVLPTLLRTVIISTMIMAIIAGALLAGRVVTVLQVAQDLVKAAAAYDLGKWSFLIAINLLWILMGDFLDVASIMLLTLPVAFPVAVQLGIDPIWFAVIMVINMELATITPPIGLNLFVVMGITGEKSLKEVLAGAAPYIALITLGLVTIMAFPQLATWLPSQH